VKPAPKRVGRRCVPARIPEALNTDPFDIAAWSTGRLFQYFFADFGFPEEFRTPAGDPNKPVQFKDEYEATQQFIDLKFLLYGTVNQARREIAALHDVHEASGNLEWLEWAFYQQGVVPPTCNSAKSIFSSTKFGQSFDDCII
jgi:hypothetical protein